MVTFWENESSSQTFMVKDNHTLNGWILQRLDRKAKIGQLTDSLNLAQPESSQNRNHPEYPL